MENFQKHLLVIEVTTETAIKFIMRQVTLKLTLRPRK